MEGNMKKIKLLYVSAEISPYASTGGLGEVGRSFPAALAQEEDYEVRRVLPLHRVTDRTMKYVTDFPVKIDQEYETCVIKKDAKDKKLLTYFVENDRYFYRDNIYGYEDDGHRYFFFCKAIVEMLKHLPYRPDIVHTNDWHCGFLPLLLKKEFPGIKTVYTIHNISYHGFIPSSCLSGLLDMKGQYQLGWPEELNFMKAGIIYADVVTTVSPGYCEEIRQTEYSCGMTPLIEQRNNGIVGILNGVDTKNYDPAAEEELEYPYDSKHPELKRKNRSRLREYYKLPEDDRPLVAIITRLDYSKGIEILLKAISYFDFKRFQLIVLGSGNPYYQGLLANISAGYPESMAVDFEYHAGMAKKIYAGADIYLMPSLFEPCGLGQLYAMRYGAVPIVNPVGGLKDTVSEDNEHPKKATGFYMKEWSGKALNDALDRALKAYQSPEWFDIVKNCMKYDSSWGKSVKEYKRQYETIL